jgi:hypothetical protein
VSTNKQQGPQAKLKRLQRELGAKATDDPDGVLAVLQTARRLLAEGGELFKDGWQEKRSRGKSTVYSVSGALRASVDLAHPRDRARAIHDSSSAIYGSLRGDDTRDLGMAHLPQPVLTRWESHPKTTLADALRVFDRAIKNQGTVNVAVSKAKGRK